MNQTHLYYHGFEPFRNLSESVKHLIDIINHGELKLRDEKNPILQHICLYRKNDNYDYSSPKAKKESARYSWIDHCIVFVISGGIKATYLPPHTTIDGLGLPPDQVDEWRC